MTIRTTLADLDDIIQKQIANFPFDYLFDEFEGRIHEIGFYVLVVFPADDPALPIYKNNTTFPTGGISIDLSLFSQNNITYNSFVLFPTIIY